MTCANDRVVVVHRHPLGATYEVSGYPLGPRGVECRAPVFDPCAEGAGECLYVPPLLRPPRHVCVTYLAAFTLQCEPCA